MSGTRSWPPAAFVAVLLVAPLPFACGSSTTDVGTTVDAGDEATLSQHEAGLADVVQSDTGRPDTGSPDTGPAGPGAHPPAPPSAPATTSVLKHDFAVHTLYLGDTPRSSVVQSTTAWKKFGFDLDGKTSTQASTDVCTLTAGAPKIIQDDGDDGIDNSFGAKILPILLGTGGSSYTSSVNQSISSGLTTVLFDTIGLTDDATQTNTGLTAQLFVGGTFSGSPTWTISDNWPVKPESLLDGASIAGGAKTQYANAYVVGGTWVNGSSKDVPVRLIGGGIDLNLIVHHAIVTFDHSAATKATNGTIAGVLDTEELITMFRSAVVSFSPSLCGSSALESISSQIRQASDISKDGTNVAGSPCTGISIGLGFNADAIAPPTTVSPPAPPPPDPCAD